MSTNRLFMLDPETNEAICIGKGYSTGWVTNVDYVDRWLEEHEEYTGVIEKTRFKLITEAELTAETKVTYIKMPNDVIQGPRSGPAGMEGQTMTETKKRTPKVSQRKIHENLQKGLDANGWSIFGTGGTKIAFINPLVEYLRKAGIEVV